MTKGEENILAFQIQELIKKQDQICADLKALFEKMEGRITHVENKVSWICGLLAGLGVVSVATLIKTFM